MSELRKILELILNDDWHDLLMYLTMEEIKANNIKTSSEDYEAEGDYETDARHTYPNRDNLIKTVIEKVLKGNIWDGVAPEDIIRMKVEDEGKPTEPEEKEGE